MNYFSYFSNNNFNSFLAELDIINYYDFISSIKLLIIDVLSIFIFIDSRVIPTQSKQFTIFIYYSFRCGLSFSILASKY